FAACVRHVADRRGNKAVASRADEYRRRAQQCLEMASTFREREARYPIPHGGGVAAVGGEATNPASIPAATANSAEERQRVSRVRRLVRWAGQPGAGFEISAAQIDYRTLGLGGRTSARIIGVLNVNAPNRSARGAADAAGTSARDDRTARPSAHSMLLHLLTA